MLGRMGKTLGAVTPIISILSAYQMWFGAKYVGSTSDAMGTQTLTALEFALKHGSTAIIFWPVCIVVLSIIGGVAAWYKKAKFVWLVAIVLFIISVLGMWSIGSAVVPLAALFLISATLLTIHQKKVDC